MAKLRQFCSRVNARSPVLEVNLRSAVRSSLSCLLSAHFHRKHELDGDLDKMEPAALHAGLVELAAFIADIWNLPQAG